MIYKYIGIGIINTGISFLVILLLFKFFAFNYGIAYFIGYVIALINSFFMNKRYTFQSNGHWKNEFKFFILVFIIAYSISHIFLYLMVEWLNIGVMISIIISMMIYTFVGYFLNKNIVFSEAQNLFE